MRWQDLWDLMEREQCSITLFNYLDGRSVAVRLLDQSSGWIWTDDGWRVATAEDMRPSVDRDGVCSIACNDWPAV